MPPNHTIHYQLEHLKRAGWIALAEEVREIVREHRHMKTALRKLKSIRNTPMPLVRETNDAWDDLESKVRL